MVQLPKSDWLCPTRALYTLFSSQSYSKLDPVIKWRQSPFTDSMLRRRFAMILKLLHLPSHSHIIHSEGPVLPLLSIIMCLWTASKIMGHGLVMPYGNTSLLIHREQGTCLVCFNKLNIQPLSINVWGFVVKCVWISFLASCQSVLTPSFTNC